MPRQKEVFDDKSATQSRYLKHEATYQVNAMDLRTIEAPWLDTTALERSHEYRYNSPERNESCQAYAQIAMQVRRSEYHKQRDDGELRESQGRKVKQLVCIFTLYNSQSA